MLWILAFYDWENKYVRTTMAVVSVAQEEAWGSMLCEDNTYYGKQVGSRKHVINNSYYGRRLCATFTKEKD